MAETEIVKEQAGEQCHACGNRYTTIYRVPNEVWAKIAPNRETLGQHPEHQFGGLLCPACADRRASELGIILYWDANTGDWAHNELQSLRSTAAEQAAEIERLRKQNSRLSKGRRMTFRLLSEMERQLRESWSTPPDDDLPDLLDCKGSLPPTPTADDQQEGNEPVCDNCKKYHTNLPGGWWEEGQWISCVECDKLKANKLSAEQQGGA